MTRRPLPWADPGSQAGSWCSERAASSSPGSRPPHTEQLIESQRPPFLSVPSLARPNGSISSGVHGTESEPGSPGVSAFRCFQEAQLQSPPTSPPLAHPSVLHTPALGIPFQFSQESSLWMGATHPSALDPLLEPWKEGFLRDDPPPQESWPPSNCCPGYQPWPLGLGWGGDARSFPQAPAPAVDSIFHQPSPPGSCRTWQDHR